VIIVDYHGEVKKCAELCSISQQAGSVVVIVVVDCCKRRGKQLKELLMN